MKEKINIFWFRRDLRLEDNAGLYFALKSGKPVLPVFIFDKNILEKLENRSDGRVEFIHTSLESMKHELEAIGSSLSIFHETPENAFQNLISKYDVLSVFTNCDYEPYAVERDSKISALLQEKNIQFHTYKDHVIFEKDEVIKDDGSPYTVFTPYSRKWKSLFNQSAIAQYHCKKYYHNFIQCKPAIMPSLNQIGFKRSNYPIPEKRIKKETIIQYQDHRNFPGIKGTTKLGIHLRFGTISIRQLALKTSQLSETYLNELIWRDFYQMILWHFPQVGKGFSFKPAYDPIEWRNDSGEFEKWCNGQTGYPIVDAGMRELNATGYMHNRVRMIVASFLSKHLLLDWRLGEAYFADHLLDFDLASNNGGWQWASGSGCDAAPYFRIFNPYIQTKKFDPNLVYIKKWVPEFQEFNYPQPIVDHEFARKRCLDTYKKALKKENS